MRRGSGRGGERYGLVFLLLLLSYALSAFSGTPFIRAVALVLYASTLLIALRVSRLSRWTVRCLSGVMVVVTLFMAFLVVVVAGNVAGGLMSLWNAALTLTTLTIVVLQVLQHEVVSLQTVFGALSAYLLIGFTFAALYSATARWSSDPFFAGGEAVSSANVQYFSFVTLTTTGYGDLTAASVFGRTLAVMEALLGQIFLVTLVARLVSVFGTPRSAVPGGSGKSVGQGRDGSHAKESEGP